MKLGRNRSDAAGRHAAEYPQAELPAGADEPAKAEQSTARAKPTRESGSGRASSSRTGQTLFGAALETPQPTRLGLPGTGPTKPWLAKPTATDAAADSAAAGSEGSDGSAGSDSAASGATTADDPAAPGPSKTRSRRRAPSEPGTVLKLLAADIGKAAPAPAPLPVQERSVARARPAPVPPAPAHEPSPGPGPAPAPAPLAVATVVAAERRLDDLSRRLNDVELRAETERQAALQRVEETEQQLTGARRQVSHAEQLVDAAEARAAAAERRAAQLEQELDAAVGLLAEHEGRRDELEQHVHDLTALITTERYSKRDVQQQSDVEHQALAARLKSGEKRLAEAAQQASLERANHRQLLERAQGALTAESQARTLIEDQLAEATRAADTLQAQQAAEIGRLNIALQAAIERRVEFEAQIAEMEAAIRAQHDAEARSWVSAEQRLAETIAALESERARGEQWRREAATEVQEQLREALAALSPPAGRHSDTVPPAERPRPRPPAH